MPQKRFTVRTDAATGLAIRNFSIVRGMSKNTIILRAIQGYIPLSFLNAAEIELRRKPRKNGSKEASK